MKLISYFVFFSFFLFKSIIIGQSQSGDKFNEVFGQLLPTPQNIVRFEGEYKLTSSAKVHFSNKNPELSKYISHFFELSDLDLNQSEDTQLKKFQITIHNDKNEITKATLPDIENKGDEAYELSVTANGVEIIANSSKGVLWGLMTLTQLIVRDGDEIVIPNVKIVDEPRYTWRGYMRCGITLP